MTHGFTERAHKAADALMDEYGVPTNPDVLRGVLALAWMQGSQSGADETMKVLNDELRKAVAS